MENPKRYMSFICDCVVYYVAEVVLDKVQREVGLQDIKWLGSRVRGGGKGRSETGFQRKGGIDHCSTACYIVHTEQSEESLSWTQVAAPAPKTESSDK